MATWWKRFCETLSDLTTPVPLMPARRKWHVTCEVGEERCFALVNGVGLCSKYGYAWFYCDSPNSVPDELEHRLNVLVEWMRLQKRERWEGDLYG